MTQVVPSCVPSERAMLCSVLSEPNAIEEVVGHVTANMLFDSSNAGLLEAILRTHKAGREVNQVTVMESLDAMGRGHLVGHMFEVTGTLHAHSLCDLVTEVRAVHQRRLMSSELLALAARCNEGSISHAEVMADVEARVSAVLGMNQGRDGGLRKIDPTKGRDEIMETIAKKGALGLSTTIRELDALMSGLSNGHVTVIGAWSGFGKTGLAISILEEASLNRHMPSAFFSLEMPEADIVKRFISRRSGVKLASMRSGKLTPDDATNMEPGFNELLPAPIFIYDTPAPTYATVRAESRRLKARVGKLAVVVVDYLQLMRGISFDNREQEVAEVSRNMKALAKELDCPVVLLSQLNDEGMKRPEVRPQGRDARESKAIYNDADAVVLIHRPGFIREKMGKGTDDGDVEFILDKNRHGPCGIAKGRFDKATASFVNGDEPPWPTTTKRDPYAHIGGSPDDGSGDGAPFDDDFDPDCRWPS